MAFREDALSEPRGKSHRFRPESLPLFFMNGRIHFQPREKGEARRGGYVLKKSVLKYVVADAALLPRQMTVFPLDL